MTNFQIICWTIIGIQLIFTGVLAVNIVKMNRADREEIEEIED